MELDIQSITSFDAQSTSSYYSGSNSARQVVHANAKDNVKVIIRVRPFNEKEKNSAGGPKKCVSVENQSTIVLEARPDYKVFNFDFVGDEELEQRTIFDTIAKPIADCCLQGYNGSIFAYGQTGSGKTFTIQGPNIVVNGEEKISFTLNKDKPDYEKRGLMPRSFEYIFECIENAKRKASEQNDHFEYLIRCTYLEIYNESIIDLLEPGSYNLHLREDIKKGVYVEGLLEENVQNEHDMMALISRGAKNRHMGSTSMNKESSRSHSVLTTIIETKTMSQSGVWNLKTSRFHIIDLAGSERAKHTNAVGDRLKEAGMINKSLSALGNVINSLVDISEGKNRHVHYRDSKLTFLLRDSLGGNSKTVIIANISPSAINSGETLSTLKFAQRAKLIKNKAVINEDSSGTIQLLKSEIIRLKKDLAESEQRTQSMTHKCTFCMNNIRPLNNQHHQDDDDDLVVDGLAEELEFLNNSNSHGSINDSLKQKYIDSRHATARMKKRVVYLEGLLTANLDTMTSQQKFYEQELAKQQLLVKKYQQSTETYEKQGSRDRMIIKFRDDRIAKLEQNLPQTIEDKHKLINEFKKEILLLKETIEHNPQLNKLQLEKVEMLQQLNQLKKEFNLSPDSLHAQIRSLTELNESLNEYLKQYCEGNKKDFENEIESLKLAQSQQVEDFKQKIEEYQVKEQEYQSKYTQSQHQWNLSVQQYKQQADELTHKHQGEKQQMEASHKAQLDQIKQELEVINENKNQKETTAQMLRIEIMEKQNEYQTLANKLNDRIVGQVEQIQQQYLQEQKLKDQISSQSTQIDQLEQQKIEEHNQLLMVIESEKKRNQAAYKHAEDQWIKRLKEQEKEMLDAQNEKQIIDQQCSELDSRVTALTQHGEELQQTLLFKEEALLEALSQIKQLQEQIENIKHQYESDKQKHEKLREELSQQIVALIKKLEETTKQKHQLENELNQLKDLNHSQLESIHELNQHVLQLNDKYGRERQNLKEQINEFKSQVEELNTQLEAKIDDIKNLNSKLELLQREFKQYQIQSSQEIQNLNQAHKQAVLSLTEEGIKKEQNSANEQQQLNQIIDDLNKKFEELQQSAGDQLRELNIQIATLESDKDDLLKCKNSEIQNLKNQWRDNEADIDIKHSQLIKDLQQEHAEELEQAEQVFRQELEQLDSSNQAQVQEMESQFQEQQQLVKRAFEKEKQDVIKSYVDKIKNIEQDYEEQLNSSQACHSNDIQQVKGAHQEQLKELSLQIQQKIEDLERHNNAQMIEQAQQYELKIEGQKINLQGQIDGLKQQCDQLKAQIQQKIEQNKNDLKSLITLQEEETRRRLLDQDQKNMQDKTALNDKFNKQLQELNAQIINWKEKLSQIQELHKNELETLNKRFEEKEKNLRSNVSNKVEEAHSLSLQLDQTKSQMNLEAQQRESVISDKEHMISILENDVKVKEKHIDNLQNQVALMDEKLKDLSEKLSQNEVAGIHQQLKITQLNEQIYAQIEQQSFQIGSSQKLQSHLEETNIELNKRKKEIENTNEKYQQVVSHNSYLEQIVEQKQQEASQLRLNMRDLQAKLNEFQNLSDNLNKQLTQSKSEISKLNQQILELDTQVADLDSEQRELLTQQSQEQVLFKDNIAQKDKIINDQREEAQQLQYDYQSQIKSIKQENERKIDHLTKQYEVAIEDLKEQLETQGSDNSTLNQQSMQLKKTCNEQGTLIKQHKETIKSMLNKESTLMAELESKVNELKVQQEKWKVNLQETKDEKATLKSNLDKSKRETENLRELVKLKDRQLDELKDYDNQDRGNLESIKKENKDLRTQVTKREFEMKEVVRTLKYYSEEKSRMEKELEKLHRENDQLIGHKNPSQKIQHHLKIKEENNKLREENYKLLEELRKKETVLQKISKSGGKEMIAFQTQQYDAQENQNNEQLQKEFHSGIAKVIEHIIAQPGLIKVLGLTEDNLDRVQQQSSVLKLKNIIDIISLLNNTLISKERDISDLIVDKKRLEGKNEILEQEKQLINQQLEFNSDSNRSSMVQDSTAIDQVAHNSQQAQTARSNFREQKGDDLANITANGLEKQNTLAHQKQASVSKLQIFIQQPTDRSNNSNTSINANTSSLVKPPSLPFAASLKLLKEKENQASKKDVTSASSNRGGSSRRSAYLSNNK